MFGFLARKCSFYRTKVLKAALEKWIGMRILKEKAGGMSCTIWFCVDSTLHLGHIERGENKPNLIPIFH